MNESNYQLLQRLMRQAGEATLVDGELRQPTYYGAALRFAAAHYIGASYFTHRVRSRPEPFLSEAEIDELRAQATLAENELRHGFETVSFADPNREAWVAAERAFDFFMALVQPRKLTFAEVNEAMLNVNHLLNILTGLMGERVRDAITEAMLLGHYSRPE